MMNQARKDTSGIKLEVNERFAPFFLLHPSPCLHPLFSHGVLVKRNASTYTSLCVFCFTESSTAAQTWWRYWRFQISSHSHTSIFSEHLMKMCFCHLPPVCRPSACWSSHRQTCRRRLLRAGGWVTLFQFRLQNEQPGFDRARQLFCSWAWKAPFRKKKTNGMNGIVVLLLKGAATIKEFYARNSRWTEGLISAAKAVGWGATEMV